MTKYPTIALVTLLLLFTSGSFAQDTTAEDAQEVCWLSYFPVSFTVKAVEGRVEQEICETPTLLRCSLNVAIEQNNVEGVRCLLRAGYDMNAERGKFGAREIPLMVAALYQPEILQLILDESRVPIDLDVTDHDGDNTLKNLEDRLLIKGGLIYRRKAYSPDKVRQSKQILLNARSDRTTN